MSTYIDPAILQPLLDEIDSRLPELAKPALGITIANGIVRVAGSDHSMRSYFIAAVEPEPEPAPKKVTVKAKEPAADKAAFPLAG